MVNWKKPDDVKDVAGRKIGLWQREGAARGSRKGPLLIFENVLLYNMSTAAEMRGSRIAAVTSGRPRPR